MCKCRKLFYFILTLYSQSVYEYKIIVFLTQTWHGVLCHKCITSIIGAVICENCVVSSLPENLTPYIWVVSTTVQKIQNSYFSWRQIIMIDFHSFHDACEAALRQHLMGRPLLFPSTSFLVHHSWSSLNLMLYINSVVVKYCCMSQEWKPSSLCTSENSRCTYTRSIM